jgi:hypothetical protein
MKDGINTQRIILQTSTKFEVETLLDQKNNPTDKKKKKTTIEKHDEMPMHTSLFVKV